METWSVIKAFLVTWAGWGFGFASGIILAVAIAVKDDVVEWYRSRWPDND